MCTCMYNIYMPNGGNTQHLYAGFYSSNINTLNVVVHETSEIHQNSMEHAMKSPDCCHEISRFNVAIKRCH